MSLGRRLAPALRRATRLVAGWAPGRRLLDRLVREFEVATRPAPGRLEVPPASGPGPAPIRLNRIAGTDPWDDPGWRMYERTLALPAVLHRKHFEWIHCLYGLENLGALGPEATALGVGAGREPVLFYLANRCGLVVATDLYQGAFARWEAVADFVERPHEFAPFDYRRQRLRVQRADGRALPFADAGFDVVFSLSSIEHFGGHHAATRAMAEIARVLRPGGVACIATELILEGGDDYEFFTPDRFRAVLLEAPGLEPVEPFDWTPPPRSLIDDPVWFDGDHGKMPHIVLGRGELRWTSAIAFLRRVGAAGGG